VTRLDVGRGVGLGWLTVAVPATEPTPPDIASLSYERARDELVAVVSRLEAGAATLEESLELWQRGEALAARCQEWLDGARERLAAVRDADGAARSGSGDDDETAD
jgi:exodeoxyribonuclease VII small subunit